MNIHLQNKRKYGVELILALFLIILLSPFMLLISIMIYLSSGKPIIFKHKRIGYQYVEFDMFKFRTMKNNGVQRNFALTEEGQ